MEDVVDYIGAKGPTKLPEYTDTDMQPDYSHPSFNANFVNARAKLERDRWLAKHGKRSRKSKKIEKSDSKNPLIKDESKTDWSSLANIIKEASSDA